MPFTTPAVVLAQTFVALPFLVLALEGSLRTTGVGYEQTAAALGAGRWTILRRVTLPLAAPGLVAGVVLCFARAIGEFGATALFAGNAPGRHADHAARDLHRVQRRRRLAGHRRRALAAAARHGDLGAAARARLATGGRAMSGAALDAHVVVERRGFRLDAAVQAAPGEIVAVMGPSGAGKSTLLGALAGLVPLDRGHVRLGERMLDAAARRARTSRPSQRGVVLLGQEPRLFPHLSARENVAFGLRAHGASRARPRMHAPTSGSRASDSPASGSGAPRSSPAGSSSASRSPVRSRPQPAAVLLDEPLTSLDPETAGDIRALLREQLAATGHDRGRGHARRRRRRRRSPHRLVVVEDGRVTQSGPVREVLGRAGHPVRRRGRRAQPGRRRGARRALAAATGSRCAASVDGEARRRGLPHPRQCDFESGAQGVPSAAGEWLARVVAARADARGRAGAHRRPRGRDRPDRGPGRRARPRARTSRCGCGWIPPMSGCCRR